MISDPNVVERGSGNRQVLAGSVSALREYLGAYIEAGIDELIIADFNLGTLDEKIETYDRFMTDVARSFQ